MAIKRSIRNLMEHRMMENQMMENQMSSNEIRENIKAMIAQPSEAWAIPQEWQALWREEILAAAREGRLPPKHEILQCPVATKTFMETAACSCVSEKCQCDGRGEDWTWYLGGAVDQRIIDEIRIINDPRETYISIQREQPYRIVKYRHDGEDEVEAANYEEQQYPDLSPEVFDRLLSCRRLDRAWLTNLVRDRPGLALRAWMWQEPGYGNYMFRLLRWSKYHRAKPNPKENLFHSRPYRNADIIASINSLIDEYNSVLDDKHVSRGDTIHGLFQYITTHTLSMTSFDGMINTDYTLFASLNPGDQRLLIFNQLVGMAGTSPQFAIIFIVIAALQGTETLSADFIELITNTAVIRDNDRFYSCLHAILAMDAAGAFGDSGRCGRPRPDGPRWPLKVSSRGTPYYRFIFIYSEMFGDSPARCARLYSDMLDWIETGTPQPSDDYFIWLFRHCIDHVLVNHSNIITKKQYGRMRDVASTIVGNTTWYGYKPHHPI